jgi:EamA-like transporter family
VTVALWASAFVAIRSAGHDFSPGALALGRLLSGLAVLGLISLRQRARLPPRAAWPGIVATGVLWFGVYMVALNCGEQHVDAGTAAMVVNIAPALIALLSGWLLGEGLPRLLLVGITVSFAGVILVGIATSTGGHPSLAGVLLCLLAAVSYAAAVVSQKSALRHASALQVTTFGCAVGLPAVHRPAGFAAGHGTASSYATRRLPGRVSHRASVHHLGVCAVENTRWQDGRHHLPGRGPDRADVLGTPGRSPYLAGAGRRRALPRRGGPLPLETQNATPQPRHCGIATGASFGLFFLLIRNAGESAELRPAAAAQFGAQ